MKLLLLAILFFCCYHWHYAQQPTLLWGRGGGGGFNASAISYNRDGSEFYAIYFMSRAIYCYDSQTGVLKSIIRDTNMIPDFSNWGDFSGDGSRVAYTTIKGSIVFREMPSGRLLHEFKDSARFLGFRVQCSYNGKFIATVSFDSMLTVWDTEKLRLHYGKQLHTRDVLGISVTSDGRYLAIGSEQATAIDMTADTVLWQADLSINYRGPGSLTDLQFSPNDSTIMIGYGYVNSHYHVSSGKPLWKRSEKSPGFITPAFSSNGKYITGTGEDNSTQDENKDGVIVYQAKDGRPIAVYHSASYSNVAVAFSPKQPRITLAGDPYADLYEWDYQADTFVRDYNESSGGDIAFLMDDTSMVAFAWSQGTTIYGPSPTFRKTFYNSSRSTSAVSPSAVNPYDSSIVHGVFGSRKGAIVFYDLDNLQIEQVSGIVRPNNRIQWDRLIYDVTFSSDGTYLAAASDSTVLLCDGRVRTIIAPLPSDSLRFTSVDFSPDNSLLAAASNSGGFVSLWNPNTRQPLPPLHAFDDSVRVARFSHDGKLLAAAGIDSTIRIFNVSDWSLRHTLRGHTNRVNDLAFAYGANRLASVSSDQTLRVWDAETGEQVAVSNAISDYFHYVAISRDNRYIGVGGRSGVYLYSASNSLGVEHIREDQRMLAMTLRPNPATERCEVELGMEWLGWEPPTVTVMDVMGRRQRVAATEEISATPGVRLTLDVSNLPAGYYVVEATGKGKRSVGGMMVVR